MPITDAANINSPGVLISSTNLNTFKLSKDNRTLSIGPGQDWGKVYNYLNGTNLMVLGARQVTVGVPGFLLGGGISFYGYEHGLASTGGKIKAYEVRAIPSRKRCHSTSNSRPTGSPCRRNHRNRD